MIDGNKLGTVGFEKLGTPYSEMDCQAFVEWCLAQCGLKKDLAGSNAWYREVLKNGWAGSPEECVKRFGKVPAGAFLFIHAFDGGEEKRGYHDGLGNASHIGIATGQGEGAIHSSSSRGCVAESRFKGKSISGGWNKVGLWTACVNYGGIGGAGSGGACVETEPEAAEPSADPEPVPVSETEYAVVRAGSGTTVNTRQGPGTSYPLSKAGRLPVGTAVEILKRRNGWCRIRCADPNGAVWYCWMKEEFLQPAEASEPEPEPEVSEKVYAVTIPHLSAEDVEALRKVYPECVAEEECG